METPSSRVDRGTDILLSIVVPVYNEADQIGPFCDVIGDVISRAGLSEIELVFVDDGSSDATWRALMALKSDVFEVTAVRLANNVGKERALVAGLAHASGKAHIPIDVDLQDPPELIPEMVQLWQSGNPVVLARRVDREDGYLKRMSASAFYRFAAHGDGAKIPADVGDFRLMDSSITKRFLEFRERRRLNKGLFALSTSNYVVMDYDRPAASRDSSRQSWGKLLSLGLTGIVSFSAWPLRLTSLVGFCLLFGSLLGIIVSVILRFTGVIEVPGQATVIVMVLLLASFQALSIGILGEYVAEILLEVKARPLYLVDEVVKLGSHQQT